MTQEPCTTRARNDAARKLAEDSFTALVNRIGPACDTFQQLSASRNFGTHLRKMLAHFAVSTLQRYLRACHVFVDFLATSAASTAKPSMETITVALLADYMLACAASKEEDRAVHLMSPLSSIKALRWLAKMVEWQALSQIMTSSVLSAYGTQSRAYDRKEAMPIPLALIVSWEELLCTQSTVLTTKLFLGAALLCTHAGLRFGDAQRVNWWTLQLSTQGLHGTAYATKTTKRGQPFACTWHGLAGRDVQSSWLLQWLACLVEIGEHASIAPDFLFFHCDLESQQFPHTFPSSYILASTAVPALHGTASRAHCRRNHLPHTAQHEKHPAGSRGTAAFRRTVKPGTGPPP